MPKVNGVSGAYAQPGRYGRTESGGFADKAWEGTPAAISSEALVADASGALWTVSESFTGAKYRLEAHYPVDFVATESPVNTWELFAEEVERDVLLANIAGIETLDSSDIRILRALINNGVNEDDPVETRLDGFALALYDMIIKGVSAKLTPVQHIRHTATVSSLYTVPHSLENVGKILSTRTLQIDEDIPSILTLPDETSVREDFKFGWYKKYPTVRTAAGHKIQIEQEWEYGFWATLLYGDLL